MKWSRLSQAISTVAGLPIRLLDPSKVARDPGGGNEEGLPVSIDCTSHKLGVSSTANFFLNQRRRCYDDVQCTSILPFGNVMEARQVGGHMNSRR